ncbi:MAG: phenylalanine--tRNA ligase subunit alpha [Candidatus Aenigmarchaeota archaeon]|nr:phenylalanine--tRNA ligase subunit alpha [Candidatus Aenigmarchaeota archaeon]
MYKLTEEGREYLKNGLPEKQLLRIIGEEKPLDQVPKDQKTGIAIGWAKRNAWIEIQDKIVKVTETGKKAANEKTEMERSLEEIDKNGKADENATRTLLKRNLIFEAKETETQNIAKEKKNEMSLWEKIISFFRRNESVTVNNVQISEIAQLTPDMIKSGSWKNATFRKYDVNAPAPKVYGGKKQPYAQFLDDMREKLIGLGFEEMNGPMVETFFWNSDALFMPQDHPARGIKDVFVLKNPTKGDLPDENLVAKVKATHEGGWITDSTGWGGTWSKEEASRLIMRSHTTPVSARTLFNVGDKPGKYFIIDRNFRTDMIDASHLMEFPQCEGIVVGENLTLSHLLGFLKEIAETVGVQDVKYKPGFFPFTEPSVELFGKMNGKWLELGGAGMFRPEVLKPLGINNCQVLAWGLGIARLAMIKLGISDIRMLYSDDLEFLRNVPMVK